jgi:integrase
MAVSLDNGTFNLPVRGASHPEEATASNSSLRRNINAFLERKNTLERRARKTLYKYRGVLKEFAGWCEKRGADDVNHLTMRLVREFENHYNKTHQPRTTHCAMNVIKGFGIWMGPRGLGMLSAEPFAQAKLPKPRPRAKYVPHATEIWAIIGDFTGQRRLQLLMLAFTGMRVDEMANLRPQDVDLEGGWIHICVRNDWSSKTHQSRTIPIHPILRHELSTYRPKFGPYFFCGESDSNGHTAPKLNDRKLLLAMQAAAVAHNIPIKRENAGIVIHSFRDFFETATVNSGAPQFVVDAWMGHKSRGSEGKTYFHLTPAMSQEWMSKMEFFSVTDAERNG